MRRGFILLAGAAVIAGGAAVMGDERAPTASISGAPLAAPTASLVEEGAGSGAPAGAPAQASGATAARAPIDTLIDLDRIERVDDHYEAPLADGRRAVLTLDPELQTLAEKLLQQSRAPRGAIVMMAPDGRILALAGRRTEDPNGGLDGTYDWRLATDVWAPAASIFKIVTASALVDAGVGASDRVCYHGGVRSVMESNLTDSKRDSRCEDLAYGVAHSNNAILGKLAYQKLTPDRLTAMATKLGFAGALPGRELPGEAGKVALPETHDLEFAKAAAGFLGTHLSAAGGALLATTFANEGERPVPRLIASIDGAAQDVPPATRVLPASIAREVNKMMVGTCESGSAARTFRRHRTVTAAGKTGTLSTNEPFYMQHSWFVGFAPADKPEVVVSVVLGNPMSWHLRGHEVAKRLIDHALRDATSREKDRTASVERRSRKQW